MKRIVSVILVFVFALLLAPCAFAASDDEIMAAETLNKLGLFAGVGTNADGTQDYDLDRAPTRNEAVTMLVRFLGKEDEAKAGTWNIPFTDVADWARPYVGYAYTNGLTNGTGDTTFGGATTITASQYLTYILRALGYASGTDFQWDKAWELTDKLGITSGEYSADSAFLRGDMVMTSLSALAQYMKGSTDRLFDRLGIDGRGEQNKASIGLKVTILALTHFGISHTTNALQLELASAKAAYENNDIDLAVNYASQVYPEYVAAKNSFTNAANLCGNCTDTQTLKESCLGLFNTLSDMPSYTVTKQNLEEFLLSVVAKNNEFDPYLKQVTNISNSWAAEVDTLSSADNGPVSVAPSFQVIENCYIEKGQKRYDVQNLDLMLLKESASSKRQCWVCMAGQASLAILSLLTDSPVSITDSQNPRLTGTVSVNIFDLDVSSYQEDIDGKSMTWFDCGGYWYGIGWDKAPINKSKSYIAYKTQSATLIACMDDIGKENDKSTAINGVNFCYHDNRLYICLDDLTAYLGIRTEYEVSQSGTAEYIFSIR